jgi:C4-dicarboxylate-specific signal transduction histidine kinase
MGSSLDLARSALDRGLLFPNMVLFHIALNLVQRELAAHRVTLRLELAPTLPLVLADRIQLQKVLIKLNERHRGDASGHRRARDPAIQSLQAPAVKDSGVGISAAAVQRFLHYQTRRHGA